MAMKALLLARLRQVCSRWGGFARHLPWVLLLTSLEGFRGGVSSVVRALGLWVWSVLSSLSLWLASFGRTFDSLSQRQVNVGKPVPLYGTDLISLFRGWFWEIIHFFSRQAGRTWQPTDAPDACWVFCRGPLGILGQLAKGVCLAEALMRQLPLGLVPLSFGCN